MDSASEIRSLMTRNPVLVDRQDTLDHALTLLERHGIRHLPVVECNRVLGMLSDRDLLLATGLLPSERRLRDARGRRLPGPERVADILRRPVHCLPGHASLARAAQDMLRLSIGAIPVVEGQGGHLECLVGIVTETDLLRALLELCSGSHDSDALARSRMHRPMPCIAGESSVDEALEALDPELRHLCIRQGEELVGIVSDRDLRLGLARSALRDARAQSERRMEHVTIRVKDLMTTRIVTAGPDTPLSHCAGRMLDHKISALPVVEGERGVGLLTQRHLLRHFAALAPGAERSAGEDAEGGRR